MVTPMFVGTIIICLATVAVCDKTTALYVETSDPQFPSIESCHEAAIARVHSLTLPDFKFEQGEEYRIEVECLPAGTNA